MTQVRWWTWRWMVAALLAGGAPGAGLAAQDGWVSLPGPGLTLVAGGFSHDAEESATGMVLGLRADFPLSGLLTLEPGLERLTWDGGNGGDETRWTADFALRARVAIGRITPYLGGNVGFLVDFAEERAPDEEFVEAAYGAHGGVKVDVLARLALVGEVRTRWFDRGDARWLLYTAGLSWRF